MPTLILTGPGKTAIRAALDAEVLSYAPALYVRRHRRNRSLMDIAVTKDDPGAPHRAVSRGVPIIMEAAADGLPNYVIGTIGGKYDLRPA